MEEEPETIEPEFEEITEVNEKIIDDNKLRIETNKDNIVFIIIKSLSYYKYIKEYNYEEIIKELELDINEYQNISEVYEYLIDCDYIIIYKEKKLKINNKEINLIERKLKNEELIEMLFDEIKEIRTKYYERGVKINQLIEKNEEKDKKLKNLEFNYNEIKKKIDELDENKKDKYKNEINIIYETEEEGNYDIFGEKFVEINKKNIELNINGTKNDLINKYNLKKGINNIKLIIKNKLTNLENMFYKCNKLKNINELKYLNTKYCMNFAEMFYECTSLSDIKPLEKWIVSDNANFQGMFYGCTSLLDKKPLEKWKLTEKNIQDMFIKRSVLQKILEAIKLQKQEKHIDNPIDIDLNKNIDIDKIKYISEVTKDSYTRNDLDNSFCFFKSIENVLLLIYSNQDKSIIAYNIIDNKIIKEIKNAHDEFITCLRHYLDSIKKVDLVMSLSKEYGYIKIWNSNNWNLLTSIRSIYNRGFLYSACFLNDKNQIYILTSNFVPTKKGIAGPIKIYNLEGNEIKELNGYSFRTYFIDIYYDKKLSKNFIITGNAGYVISYDYDEEKIYHKYMEGTNIRGHFSIVMNSSQEIIKLIESCFDGIIRIWDFHLGSLIKKIDVNSGELYGIFLLNYKYLFVGCEDKTIKIIDLENGIISKSLNNHNGKVVCVKIINNSGTSYILSQGFIKDQIKLWKIDN